VNQHHAHGVLWAISATFGAWGTLLGNALLAVNPEQFNLWIAAIVSAGSLLLSACLAAYAAIKKNIREQRRLDFEYEEQEEQVRSKRKPLS
jgi:hypothetical protein